MTRPGPYPQVMLSASDVAWMRGLCVPADWRTTQVRHLVSDMRAGDAIATEHIEPSGTYPVYGGNGIRGYAERTNRRGTHVLVGRQGALCGNVHLVHGDFWASEHAIVVTPRPNVDPGWLAFLLTTMNLGEYSTSAAQPGIGVTQIARLRAHVPALDLQRAISYYLDRETAQIDTLIEKQCQLIETLRERRAAIRDQHFQATVGKRLTTVRRVLQVQNRPAAAGLGVVTAYRDGVVTLRSNRRQDGYTLSDTEHGYQEVLPGDLVFHALDGFAGAVGISDSHGNATPVYHVCRTIAGDEPEYVAMLLRYLGVSGFLATQAPTVRQRSVDFRNWSTFARIPLTLPPEDGQFRVVSAINEQSTKIDALITKARDFVNVSKERRSALIIAAVTGQIDLRDDPEAMVAAA